MDHELKATIAKLQFLLSEQSLTDCVACSLFFNAEGFEINYQFRPPESLKNDGISMRNLRGEFIK